MHCNTLRHIATHCNTLQHNASHCNTQPHAATHCNTPEHNATHCNALQHTMTHCNTPQHTATHRNTPQHTATHCNTLQHTAKYRNTLQHTATHYDTLQYTDPAPDPINNVCSPHNCQISGICFTNRSIKHEKSCFGSDASGSDPHKICCGTGFITQPGWLFHFHPTKTVGRNILCQLGTRSQRANRRSGPLIFLV